MWRDAAATFGVVLVGAVAVGIYMLACGANIRGSGLIGVICIATAITMVVAVIGLPILLLVWLL